MKSFLKWLAGVLVVFFLIIFTFVVVFVSLTDTEPQIVANSYLQINLSGSLDEYMPPDPLEEVLGRSSLDLKKIRDVLEKAQVDERINGVLLKISYPQIGFGKLQELSNLIKEFRKNSPKKIYAYLSAEMSFTRDYYLASACDSIFMPAQANLFLTGLRSEITFYKSFFNMIGVEAEFVHVGKYKNAPDTYTRDSMSEPHREVLSSLLDQYFEDIVATIASNRNISKETVIHFINQQTGFTGQEAYAAGLVDSLAFKTDVVNLFNINGEEPNYLNAVDYALVPASSLDIRNQSRIAVVYCEGTITGGSNSEDYLLGKLAGASTLIANLRSAAASRLNKAIILRINSPGGSASASEKIWDAVRRAADQKPLVVSFSDYGASGGYYMAVDADSVIAEPASLIGSIGIFAGKFNMRGLYNKLDLKNESLQRGKNAGLFSVMQPWTSSEKAIIERLITQFYDDFLLKVSSGRQIPLANAQEIAGGRIWTGKEGVKNGLVDATGHFYDAVEATKILAGIDSSESVRLVYYPREKSFLSEILSSIEAGINSILNIGHSQIKFFIQNIEQLQNKPMALLPFRIEWK